MKRRLGIPSGRHSRVHVLALGRARAWANGEEFFAPAKNGKIDLVYFGRIKDSQTGRSVTDSV